MTEVLAQAEALDVAASADLLAAQEGWDHRLAVGIDGAPVLVTPEGEVLDRLADPTESLRRGEVTPLTWAGVERIVTEAVVESALHREAEVVIGGEVAGAAYVLTLHTSTTLLRALRERSGQL